MMRAGGMHAPLLVFLEIGGPDGPDGLTAMPISRKTRRSLLSAFSFRLSAFSFQLSAFSFRLSALGFQLCLRRLRQADNAETEGFAVAVRRVCIVPVRRTADARAVVKAAAA